MNTTTQQALEAARIKLDQVSAELRALEARAAEEARGPWEPKGGPYYHTVVGAVSAGPGDDASRIAGSEYPTRGAAASALPYITFFKRLCCLAAELNPSGKVGGLSRVDFRGDAWTANTLPDVSRDPWDLFETKDAALKACEIMNRDGWKTPAL